MSCHLLPSPCQFSLPFLPKAHDTTDYEDRESLVSFVQCGDKTKCTATLIRQFMDTYNGYAVSVIGCEWLTIHVDGSN